MQRAYMLLRDNREVGPFTIDDLMQQQLRRGDLVWIEGESHAWSTPEEIPELKLEINKGKARPDEIELRAEALRKRIMEYKPIQIEWKRKDQNLAPSNQEEVPFEFVDHSRGNGVKMYDVLALFLVSAFAGLLYYGGKQLYNNRAFLAMETATASVVKPEERIVLSAPQEPAAAYAPFPDTTAVQDSIQQLALTPVKRINRKPQITTALKDTLSAQQSIASNTVPPPITEKEEENKVKEEPKKETETERETVKETVKADTTSKKEDVTSAPKKKKKGLFKAIFGGKD